MGPNSYGCLNLKTLLYLYIGHFRLNERNHIPCSFKKKSKNVLPLMRTNIITTKIMRYEKGTKLLYFINKLNTTAEGHQTKPPTTCMFYMRHKTSQLMLLQTFIITGLESLIWNKNNKNNFLSFCHYQYHLDLLLLLQLLIIFQNDTRDKSYRVHKPYNYKRTLDSNYKNNSPYIFRYQNPRTWEHWWYPNHESSFEWLNLKILL